MKTVDYINALTKENSELKATCKTHAETIRLLKRELWILKNSNLKKDKKIQNLESESYVSNEQIELEKVNNELKTLKIAYAELQNEFNDIVKKNENQIEKPQKSRSELSKLRAEYNTLKRKYDELVQIFEEAESTCESEK